jgi:hypothetical protein
MLIIQSGSSGSIGTHVLMGIYGDGALLYRKNVELFTDSNKAIYNDFFNLVGSHATIALINSPYTMMINHVIPGEVSNEIVEIDYESLSESERSIVDLAYNTFVNEF